MIPNWIKLDQNPVFMIVFNLTCQHQHSFEGWFRSAEDFESQHKQGLVVCPICGDAEITRGLSAPRLNVAASRQSRSETGPTIEQMQSLWYKTAREVLRSTEDVGERFAEEARKIHYKESPDRAIRGKATAEERAELREEGIDVYALPIPDSLKEPLQ